MLTNFFVQVAFHLQQKHKSQVLKIQKMQISKQKDIKSRQSQHLEIRADLPNRHRKHPGPSNVLILIFFNMRRKNKSNNNEYIIINLAWVMFIFIRMQSSQNFLLFFFYGGRDPGRQKCLRPTDVTLAEITTFLFFFYITLIPQHLMYTIHLCTHTHIYIVFIKM